MENAKDWRVNLPEDDTFEKLMISVSSEWNEKIRKLAKENNTSISRTIRLLVDEGIESLKRKEAVGK